MSECTSTTGLSDRDLLRVQKPAQYIGGELNSVVKDDAEVDVHFALCFPDTYEVGMSHVGLQILYSILNDDPKTWAERVYMPMADMEQLLIERQLPLQSLESQRSLRAFDVLGFSLQYELCGTNILSILQLGGMKLYAAEREDSDPLVMGGGPYSYHPEALAPFFDAFFLGDAEEAILEVVAITRALKTEGKYSKRTLIERLRSVEGIYIPSDYTPKYDQDGSFTGLEIAPEAKTVITRRLLPSMEGAPYPKKPLVPNIQTVHNRLSVEVMRGCVRGCRFCQAGYLYRPQRERSPEEIRQIIAEQLPASGYEELSLLSLSTADYCSIVPLLKNLMDTFAADDRLAISFPSTRVDALKPEVLEQVQRVRRTGFTVAPEAGTQRLRDVINKGVSDDQIIETCSNVFKMGWTGIKLYFMLGLPTETDEDLDGIVSIATRAKALPEARGKDVTVSVSTMVPKPHTPFQWAQQISIEETIRRQRYLGERLRRIGATFRYHNSFSTFLEGIFCRAGRELAPTLVRAFELGCRLDAWQDHLREDLWLQAFQETNIDPTFYLQEIDEETPLPWDHLSCGIPKSYFLKEWQRAVRAKETADCLTTSCSTCGACNYDTKRNILWPRTETEAHFGQSNGTAAKTAGESEAELALVEEAEQAAVERIRLTYEKRGTYRFVGHLELVSVFHRAARRAGIPLAFSKGFHPMPRLSFGPPLQLGVESLVEYLDVQLVEVVSETNLVQLFNSALPEGISVADAQKIKVGGPSLHEAVVGHHYRASWSLAPSGGVLAEIAKKLSATDLESAPLDHALAESLLSLAVSRERKPSGSGKGRRGAPSKPKEKTFELRDFISNLKFGFSDGSFSVEFLLHVDHRIAAPKPSEAISVWTDGEQLGDYSLTKLATFFRPDEDVAVSGNSLLLSGAAQRGFAPVGTTQPEIIA